MSQVALIVTALLLVVTSSALANQPVKNDVPVDQLISLFKQQEILLKTIERTLQLVKSKQGVTDMNIKTMEKNMKLVAVKIDNVNQAVGEIKAHLFRCPSEFFKNSYGCYNFSTAKVTVSVAETKCAEHGGYLAVIDTPGELEALKVLMKEERVTNDWSWVGGKRKNANTFTWDGTDVTIDFNWRPGMSASFNAHWGYDCLHLLNDLSDSRHGTWYPSQCFSANYYICEI